jgi:hypothetical protein
VSNTRRLKPPPPLPVPAGIDDSSPGVGIRGGDGRMLLDIDSVLAAESTQIDERVVLKFRGKRWLFKGATEAPLSLFDENLTGAAALVKFLQNMLADPCALDEPEEIDEETGEKIPNTDEDLLLEEGKTPAEKPKFPEDVTLAEASALMQVYAYHLFGMLPGE